ncbi:MAG: ComEA family DNA-binding protein [Anaerolineae bacterium]
MESWWQRSRGWLIFVTVIVALAGVILFQALRPRPEPIRLATLAPSPQPSPEPSPTASPLRVYVSGAVRQPDVYTLPPGSIVKDALLAAGGATVDADLDRINLALTVAEGQHVYVPHQGETEPPVQPPVQQPAAPSTAGGRVNINTADAAALEELPGIGPSLAQRILDFRQTHGPFAQIEDIQEVSGIGPATFAKIQDLITTK